MKKIFLFLSLGFYFLSLAYASEKITVDLPSQDILDLDNFEVGGNCLGMSMLEHAVQAKLIQFKPFEKRMSKEDVRKSLESLECTELPIVISGFWNVEELSVNYSDVLLSFLKEYSFDLNCKQTFDVRRFPDIFGFSLTEKEIVQEMLKHLRQGESIVLMIDGNGEQGGKKINHAVLVSGAEIFSDDKITFEIYDPNMPHRKKISWENGIFHFEPFNFKTKEGIREVRLGETPVFLFRMNILEKFKMAKKYIHQVETTKDQIGTNIDGIGSIKTRRKFLGGKTSYVIQFDEQTIFPITSETYDLKSLEGKEVAFSGHLRWQDKDELIAEDGRPVYEVDTLYEKTLEKRVPLLESERQHYQAIGNINRRAWHMHRKGAYEVSENGHVQYILKSDIGVFEKYAGQVVGIKGTVVDYDRKIPVIEVSDVDDFKVPVYREIPIDK